MDLKSLEDWVVERNLKAVPNIVTFPALADPLANIK
jgi:hypothetical protein